MSVFDMGPAILFCPADRPDRYGKAIDNADAIILDLEDAVAPQERGHARKLLITNPTDPDRTIVRINPAGTADFALDLLALQQTQYRHLMLAKTEEPESLKAIADYSVVALCETAKGIAEASDIAAVPNVVALMWGAEDLVVSLGGTSSRTVHGRYRAVATHARSAVLIAGGAAMKPVIDSVFLDITNLSGLTDEAADAAASGFASKACIHPSQVKVVREAYAPTPQEVAEAFKLLKAAAEAGHGVFSFQGKMIDEPILRHAEATLKRAGLAG